MIENITYLCVAAVPESAFVFHAFVWASIFFFLCFAGTLLVLIRWKRRALADMSNLKSQCKQDAESARLLKAVFKLSEVGYSVKDVDDGFRFVVCNRAFSEMVNRSIAEIIGHDDYELAFTAFNADVCVSQDREVIRTGKTLDTIEQTNPGHPDNRAFRVMKMPLVMENGRRLVLGVFMEVTDHVMLEAEQKRFLAEKGDLLGNAEVVSDCLREALLESDFTKAVNFMLEKIGRKIGADHCDIFRFSNDYSTFECVYSWYRAEDDVVRTPRRYTISIPALLSEMQNRRMIRVDDFSKLENLPDGAEALAQNFHMKSVLVKDIRVNDRLAGVLKIDFTRQCHTFNENDIRLLNEAVNLYGLIRIRNRQTLQLNSMFENERIINTCLESIVVEDNPLRAAETVLREIRLYIGASRGYILRHSPDSHTVRCVARSAAEGLAPLLPEGTGVPLSTDEEWYRKLLRHEIIIGSDLTRIENRTLLGNWAHYFDNSDIRYLHTAGIYAHGVLWGNVGFLFDSSHNPTEHNPSAGLLPAISHLLELLLLRAETKNQLHQIEREERTVLDNIRIPIFLYDPRGNLVRTNLETLNLAGMKEKELLETPCNQVFCKLNCRENGCPVLEVAKTKKSASAQFVINGRACIVTAEPVTDETGKLINIVKSIIDIEDIEEGRRQQAKALKAAQEAERAKSYFLASVSHEIRTPLNSVIGFSELLKDRSLSPEERDSYLDAVQVSGKALLNLIDDVLDLSKIEANQISIHPAMTDLSPMIRDTIDTFAPEAAKKGIAFVIDARNLPAVRVDAKRIRQILWNLIDNAVKFTDEGGVNVRITFTRQTGLKGEIEFTVSDTGPGIPADDLRKLYQPFVELSRNRGTGSGKSGTGLGLAVCRRLVGRMDGKAYVESEIGKGSKFGFRLFNVMFEELTTNRANSPAVPVRPVLSLPLLAVDDVPLNLKVLSAMLGKLSRQTLTASSGKEALEILETTSVSAVLTDLWMPEINGGQLAKQIRADHRFDSVRLIAVTADTDASNSFDMKLFDCVLTKPVTLAKLRKALES